MWAALLLNQPYHSHAWTSLHSRVYVVLFVSTAVHGLKTLSVVASRPQPSSAFERGVMMFRL